jgi:hypothetical protein
MTEAEWLACDDPTPMLEFLRGKASDRKLRLVVCACCRSAWELLDGTTKNLVEAVECDEANWLPLLNLWAVVELDRRLTGESASNALIVELPPWWSMKMALLSAQIEPVKKLVARIAVLQQEKANNTHAALQALAGDELRAARNAWATAQAAKVHEQVCQSLLIREIIGNPFRPSSPLVPAVLGWNARTIPRLAEAVYDDRKMPEGTLDNARLAVLADDLLDAGCDDEALIQHCRQPGSHVRGCWAVDLILGKS